MEKLGQDNPHGKPKKQPFLPQNRRLFIYFLIFIQFLEDCNIDFIF